MIQKGFLNPFEQLVPQTEISFRVGKGPPVSVELACTNVRLFSAYLVYLQRDQKSR